VLAARLGFGWFGEYQGPDLAIDMAHPIYNQFGGTADAPLVIWIPPDGHDRGISQHPEEFPNIFDQLSGWRYISMNGYIGFMHAKVAAAGGDSLVLTLTYDDHYCSYFRDHPHRGTSNCRSLRSEEHHCGRKSAVCEVREWTGDRQHSGRPRNAYHRRFVSVVSLADPCEKEFALEERFSALFLRSQEHSEGLAPAG